MRQAECNVDVDDGRTVGVVIVQARHTREDLAGCHSKVVGRGTFDGDGDCRAAVGIAVGNGFVVESGAPALSCHWHDIALTCMSCNRRATADAEMLQRIDRAELDCMQR
jgi:hypothetical protein